MTIDTTSTTSEGEIDLSERISNSDTTDLFLSDNSSANSDTSCDIEIIEASTDSFSVAIKEILKQMAPVFIVRLSIVGSEYFINIYRSRLGEDELAASGLIQGTTLPISLFLQSILMGASPQIQEVIAKNKPSSVGKIFRQSFIISSITVILILPIIFLMKGILLSLGQSESNSELTQNYYEGWATGLVGFVLANTTYTLLTGLNKHWIRSGVAVVVAGITIGIGYPLIYGTNKNGLGVFGSGIAIASGYCLRGLFELTLICLIKDFKKYQLYNFKNFSSEFKLWQPRLWKEGLPILIVISTEILSNFVPSIFSGLRGKTELAVTNIIFSYAFFNDLVVTAAFTAQSNLLRIKLAKNQLSELRRYGNIGFIVGGFFTSLLAVPMLTIPEQIAGMFIESGIDQQTQKDIVNMAIPGLRYGAAFIVTEIIKYIATFNLYGIDDIIYGIAVNFITQIVSIPLMYALSNAAELGPSGLMIALTITNTLAAIFLLPRWFYKSHDARMISQKDEVTSDGSQVDAETEESNSAAEITLHGGSPHTFFNGQRKGSAESRGDSSDSSGNTLTPPTY